jgi:type IV secretory pathway VirB2 component (pilin)
VKSSKLTCISPRLSGLVLAVAVAGEALASLAGTGLPWDNPLTVLRENITGPTITAIIFISVAAALAMWAWSSHNDGLARAGKAIAALAVVGSLVTFFGVLGINFALL